VASGLVVDERCAMAKQGSKHISLTEHSKNKKPVLGNAIPVLGLKLKRGYKYFGNFST